MVTVDYGAVKEGLDATRRAARLIHPTTASSQKECSLRPDG
jgi:hypothetical protein